MTKPIISVIIPTFQPGDYILDCLKSLSEQSISNDLFEVLIILNGTKEPYFKFIQEALRERDDALDVQLLYTHKKGVSNARNIGLNHARGAYISFLDDDDFLSLNYLNGLYETLLKQENTIQNEVVVCANIKTFDGSTYGEDYLSAAFKKCSKAQYGLVKYRHFLSGMAGKLIPKQMIGKVQFNNHLTIGEDSVFLFELSNKIRLMVLTNEDVFYVRRIREGSAITKKRSRKERFSIYFKLSFIYTKTYFKSPFSYNFALYTTRMLAAFRTLIQVIFRNT